MLLKVFQLWLACTPRQNTDFPFSAQSQCGEVMYATSDRGQLTSPGYPSNYPNSVSDCVTKLYAGEGEQIRVYFDLFNLESNSQCNYDYLEVCKDISCRITKI